MQLVSNPLKSVILAVVGPRRLRWVGLWLLRFTLGWRHLWSEVCPRKIHWGWMLLLAIALVLVIGECGPAASAITARPCFGSWSSCWRVAGRTPSQRLSNLPLRRR